MDNLLEHFTSLGFDIKILFTIASIVLAAILINRAFIRFLTYLYSKDGDVSAAERTRLKFFKNASSFFVLVMATIAIIYTIPTMRTLAVTLFAGAGIMVAIIGLAAQKAFGNIVSGVFIVIFKPFRVGDIIQIGGLHSGTVEDITLRHTVINNWENRKIIIPNSVISEQTIINSSIEDQRTCQYVEIGISYSSDLDLAKRLLAEKAMEHPNCLDNRTPEEKSNGTPVVRVRVVALQDSAVLLRAYAWAKHPTDAIIMKYDLFETVKAAFDSNGIEIPYPHRTVYHAPIEG